MSKRRKPKPHSGPNETGGKKHQGNNMSDTPSNIHVRGEIEVHPESGFTEKRDAEHTEDDRKEKNRFTVTIVVQVLTLIAVIVYAGLTARQASLTRKIVEVSQKTYDASERPYVGVNHLTVIYISHDKTGDKTSSMRISQTYGFDFTAEIKNFGPVPGTDFEATWKIFINDIYNPGKPKIEDTASMLFPGEAVLLGASIRNDSYFRLINGSDVLNLEISIAYGGPAGRYHECERKQFSPDVGAFISLGECKHST